ncbi:MAG: hypothetical protein JST22_00565 [Bacteroidetes bacterium]|nr:hypothetical protein [Bacteroidota bacterium]
MVLQNGNLLLANTSNTAAELRLQEPSGGGTSYLALRVGSLSSNVTLELPAQQGAANTVLTNNGSGVLSWSDAGTLAGANLWSTNGNAGLVNPILGTLDDQPIRFTTGSGGPHERMRIDPAGNVGIGTTTPQHPLHVVNGSSTDETAAVYGVAARTTTNQAIGVWGDADSTGAGNTGSIGVLATGNGNTAAGTTNAALQVSDGSFNVGRTTETGTAYTLADGATSGTAYSAEGPSGVIAVNNLGNLVGTLAVGQSLILNQAIINNRYVTPKSIILVQVLQASGNNLNGLTNLTFSTLVNARANGSFTLSVSAQFAGLLPVTLGATDGIRVGYLVVNPAQ